MNWITIILTGIGLAMDAAAVSIAKGMCFKQDETHKYAWKLAGFFAVFQGGMALIGYLIGSRFNHSYIEDYDHWIAFILLGIIGTKMIKDAFEVTTIECETTLSTKTIIILAIATSIDALAVGISFVFLDLNILFATSAITIITFIISFFCVFMGRRLGNSAQKYAEIIGGIILVGIGTKILIEHLLL